MTAPMRVDSVKDSAGVATDDTGDLWQAVASFGVVANEPSEFLTCSSHGLGSLSAAELKPGDSVVGTDGIDEVE